MKHPILLALLALVLAGHLAAQSTPSTPTNPVAPSAPTAPQGPVSPATESSDPAGASQANPGSGGLTGTWVVERAVYDFITVLKDVKDLEGTYYKRLTFAAQGKGKITYTGKADQVDMEYDMREQGLTIAYGSRLKPQTDLFQVLYLADGKLFLKSRRLGTMNGTMFYILSKEK